MRKIFCLVLGVLSLYGCGAPPVLPAGPALTPGTYVGEIIVTVKTTGWGKPTITNITRSQESLTISPSGLPIIDGKEVAVGDVFYMSGGDIRYDLLVSSVMVTQDGVTLQYDVVVYLAIEDTLYTLTGTEVVTLQALSANQLRYTRAQAVGQVDGDLLMSKEVTGILSR